MPNIKPVSDLSNYTEVLRDVAMGEPVFLTQNGRGKYVILDMADYEKMQAALRLMSELAMGRKSGDAEDWLTLEAVEEHLGIACECSVHLVALYLYCIAILRYNRNFKNCDSAQDVFAQQLTVFGKDFISI